MLREHTTSCLASWIQVVRGSSPSPLSLEWMLCSPFPQWEPFSRAQPRESDAIEIIWVVYVNEPSQGLCMNF